MSNHLFLPSMPELAEHFAASANLVANAITMWFFGAMLLQLILGPLSDYYGRKRLLLISGILLLLASLACAASINLGQFLLSGFFQGVAVSGIMVTAFAAIHDASEQTGKATTMLGYVGMCTALSPILGPLFGGYLAVYGGWQANFYLTAVIMLVLLMLLQQVMPEAVPAVGPRAQVKDLVKNYRTLLANSRFVTSIICYGLLFFAGGAFLAAAPFVYVQLLQLPPEHIGFGMTPMFICYLIAAGLAGQLEQRWSANTLIRVGLSVTSLVMIIFMIASQLLPASLPLMMIPIAIYYLALGLVGPPLNHISLSQAEQSSKGSAAAWLTTIMMLGSTLGAWLMSLTYNQQLSSVASIMGGSVILAGIRINRWYSLWTS